MRTIWDGEEFTQVSPEQAEKMVKADMAQDLTDLPIVTSDVLKYRGQFSGYANRAMQADTAAEIERARKAKLVQVEDPDSVEIPDWLDAQTAEPVPDPQPAAKPAAKRKPAATTTRRTRKKPTTSET